MRLSDIKLLSGLAKEYLHDTIMGDGCPVKRLIGSGVIGVRDLPLHHLRRQVGTTRTTGAAAYPFQAADRANGVAGAGVSGREKAREHIHSQAFLPLNLERALD